MINPVAGADTASWNPITFWYHPWGSSVTHKGIDIFRPVNTPIVAPQSGFIYWRSYNGKGDTIGYLGTTGNAAGKTPHLHYHIITLVPYPWRITREKQGWRKMFYLDPGEKIKSGIRLLRASQAGWPDPFSTLKTSMRNLCPLGMWRFAA